MPGYIEFVRKCWTDLQIEGRKAYVLKEKWKALKQKLWEWNKDRCGNIDQNILKAKEVVA